MTEPIQNPVNQQPSAATPDTTANTPESQPLPPPPALPYTFKANLAEYRKRLGVFRIVLALGISLLIWVRFGFVAWLISAAAIVFVVLFTMILLSRRTITLTVEGAEYVNGWGARRKIAYGDMKNSKVFVNYLEYSFGLTPRVIIGQDKKPFVSLIGLYWRLEDIDLLLATLQSKNVQVDFYADPAPGAAIAKQFPESVGFAERHPFLLAFGIVVAILVAVTIFILATGDYF